MQGDLPRELITLGPVTGHLEGNDFTAAIVYLVNQHVTDHRAWVAEHKQRLHIGLRVHGAIMLRGLPTDLQLFTDIVKLIGGEPLPYTERSTPRTEVGENVYTSTEYPSDQPIPMHNENSYSDTWPSILFFLCQTAAETGGATPIADSRSVFGLIPAEVRQRFAGGVLYARSFRDGIGLSWQEAFQTASRAEVEAYCILHNQELEWTNDGLRTRHIRPAWQREPQTGAQVWFNQTNLFHVSALDDEIREVLLSEYGLNGLPRNAYLANGAPILADDLKAINSAYRQASLVLPYRQGDVLVITNMLIAHGREAYRGRRKVLVAMC
jgi:alpha-ketoglutarate-dependent taurine dioxygenase